MLFAYFSKTLHAADSFVTRLKINQWFKICDEHQVPFRCAGRESNLLSNVMNSIKSLVQYTAETIYFCKERVPWPVTESEKPSIQTTYE
jgi:hypothetical protein